MLVGRRAPRAIEPGGLVIWPGPAPGLRGGVRGQARRWAPGSEVRIIRLALAIGPTMLRAAPTKERITSVTGNDSKIKRSLLTRSAPSTAAAARRAAKDIPGNQHKTPPVACG